RAESVRGVRGRGQWRERRGEALQGVIERRRGGGGRAGGERDAEGEGGEGVEEESREDGGEWGGGKGAARCGGEEGGGRRGRRAGCRGRRDRDFGGVACEQVLEGGLGGGGGIGGEDRHALCRRIGHVETRGRHRRIERGDGQDGGIAVGDLPQGRGLDGRDRR
ncbi:hypothetical protein VE25_01925, partial [Devosia geojensis]